MRIVTVEQMRAIEAAAEKDFGLDGPTLMASAGASAAQLAAEWLGGDVAGTRWLFLLGPGNNGGDGRVMAGHLSDRGAEIALFDWRAQRLEDLVGTPLAASLDDLLEIADVVVDAWLGIGHARPLGDGMIAINKQVRTATLRRHGLPRILAVDLPSGVDADSGAVDVGTLAADLTITLGAPKIGLFFFPAQAYIGQLRVGSIGLPPTMELPGGAEWVQPEEIANLIPPRPLDGHKGTFGKTLIVAGSQRYPGAAILASRAAARTGTGLVTIAATLDRIPPYNVALPEAVFVPLTENPAEQAGTILVAAAEQTAMLMGPGIDHTPESRVWLLDVLRGLSERPADERPRLVLDADALNILSVEPEWWRRVPPGSVITPHPGEMGRLIGGGRRISGGEADRLSAVREYAARWGLVVVLKGAVTLVAGPDGEGQRYPHVHAAPNPAMATAGMGDILGGTIVSLLAQGLAPFDAATLGVALHSEAGAQAARDLGFVRAGLLASDVAERLPAARAHFEQLHEL